MTTITKERLQEVIDGDILFTDEQRELARIALASLTAEPVAWMCEDEEGREYNSSNEFSCGRFGVPLYAAPPAPVVPEKLPCSVELKPGLIIGKGCKTETLLTALRRRADYYAKIDAFTPEERAKHDASIEAFKAMLPTPADSQGRPRAPVVPPAIEPDYKVIKSILPTANPDEYACCIAADMWNACRDAMFQGSQPVSNRDELSSPVILDGYALVPVEPTPEMREAFHVANEEYESGSYDVWKPDHQWQAMLAAAPQLKIALASIERCQAGFDAKHALFEVAIARFSKMNEGFPIKRFKADWVISWMLENFPPVAQKQGDN
ncbi:TPA: hypothetical protein ACS5XU_002425 [Salmonella enterica]|uniref:hypothetical protein n=1 Tax=Salmonella TaxID=590 RepID=UPI001F101E1E|nr:hypothetical protein [Salmonella enterica]MCH5682397.1 hypothetical protein [Salmonella enterica]MCH5695644.1 hypothetical protein [Salmonella enterica]MCH5700444.1 hypothetical protein [Salmonella enterica]MCJ9812633.1 hypothetical protein [Salmonella enterica subsp. enterica serovar Kentucky]MDJ7959585.1 hypothetical protein [Salmonella enterica]